MKFYFVRIWTTVVSIETWWLFVLFFSSIFWIGFAAVLRRSRVPSNRLLRLKALSSRWSQADSLFSGEGRLSPSCSRVGSCACPHRARRLIPTPWGNEAWPWYTIWNCRSMQIRRSASQIQEMDSRRSLFCSFDHCIIVQYSSCIYKKIRIFEWVRCKIWVISVWTFVFPVSCLL